jgi:hypothetical protein
VHNCALSYTTERNELFYLSLKVIFARKDNNMAVKFKQPLCKKKEQDLTKRKVKKTKKKVTKKCK